MHNKNLNYGRSKFGLKINSYFLNNNNNRVETKIVRVVECVLICLLMFAFSCFRLL